MGSRINNKDELWADFLERVSKIVLYVAAIAADALEIRVSQDRRNQGR
jgi:hypothetical protein